MRLAASILTAGILHGLALGAVAAVVEPRPVARLASAIVEVDLVPAQPDPARDSAPPPEQAPVTRTHVPNGPNHAPERPITPTSEATPSNDGERAAPPVTEKSAPATDPTPATTAAVSASASASASVSAASIAPASSASKPLPSQSTIASAKPHYRSNPRPDYPSPSRRRREEGVVYLNVSVRSDGVPTSISLGRSSGYPLLDRAALDAVARWTFEPARAAGVAVSSIVSIPIRFSLSENQ